MFGFRRHSGLTAADAVRLAAEGGVVLLDVRNADEIAQHGKAKGALTIPMAELDQRADPAAARFEPRLGEGKPIAIYCASGIRSGKAAAALKRFGLAEAHNIGGLSDWVKAGGVVE
jgi:rhodanese-related sulfurtransferase